jgi:hypothetical protein
MIIGPFILLAVLGLITYAIIMNVPWSRKNVTNAIITATVTLGLPGLYIVYRDFHIIWDSKRFGTRTTSYHYK